MAARLLSDKKAEGPAGAGARKSEGGILADDRFSRLFEDAAYAIDEAADEFKSLHPNARKGVTCLLYWWSWSPEALQHGGCIHEPASYPPYTSLPSTLPGTLQLKVYC